MTNSKPLTDELKQMDPLRLAVVGVGLIGKRHVEIIQQTDAMVLTAIVDPTDEARQYAKEQESE